MGGTYPSGRNAYSPAAFHARDERLRSNMAVGETRAWWMSVRGLQAPPSGETKKTPLVARRSGIAVRTVNGARFFAFIGTTRKPLTGKADGLGAGFGKEGQVFWGICPPRNGGIATSASPKTLVNRKAVQFFFQLFPSDAGQ